MEEEPRWTVTLAWKQRQSSRPHRAVIFTESQSEGKKKYSGEVVVVSVRVTEVAGLFAGGNWCWSPAASSSDQVFCRRMRNHLLSLVLVSSRTWFRTPRAKLCLAGEMRAEGSGSAGCATEAELSLSGFSS